MLNWRSKVGEAGVLQWGLSTLVGRRVRQGHHPEARVLQLRQATLHVRVGGHGQHALVQRLDVRRFDLHLVDGADHLEQSLSQ
jgi:hypothetical protein